MHILHSEMNSSSPSVDGFIPRLLVPSGGAEELNSQNVPVFDFDIEGTTGGWGRKHTNDRTRKCLMSISYNYYSMLGIGKVEICHLALEISHSNNSEQDWINQN